MKKKLKKPREELIEKLMRDVKGLTKDEAETILDTVKWILKDSYKANRPIRFIGFRDKPFEFSPEELGRILYPSI